jgi:hypothetical protein
VFLSGDGFGIPKQTLLTNAIMEYNETSLKPLLRAQSKDVSHKVSKNDFPAPRTYHQLESLQNNSPNAIYIESTAALDNFLPRRHDFV